MRYNTSMEIFNIKVELIIDFIGILTAVVSIIMLFGLKNSIRGRVGTALNYVLIGILFQTTAFVWTIVFVRLGIFPKPLVDVHHLLMTFGMISFVFAAHKFSLLNQPE